MHMVDALDAKNAEQILYEDLTNSFSLALTTEGVSEEDIRAVRALLPPSWGNGDAPGYEVVTAALARVGGGRADAIFTEVWQAYTAALHPVGVAEGIGALIAVSDYVANQWFG
jgi:hypothetical protein